MTPAQIAEEAIGLFLELLGSIEDSGVDELDEDAVNQAIALAVIEIVDGCDVSHDLGKPIGKPPEDDFDMPY